MITKEKINAEVGHLVNISLQSKVGSTGYGWELAKLDGGVHFLDVNVSHPTRIGGSSEHVFQFRAVHEGTAIIEFVLAAPWKIEDTDPEIEIHYEITVVKKAESDSETENLKLKGFVGKPTVSISDIGATTLYAVQPPVDLQESCKPPRSIPSQSLLKYGVPPRFKYAYPRALYNIPPRQLYAYPASNADCCSSALPYGFPCAGEDADCCSDSSCC